MFRCQICDCPSQPGEAPHRHPVYKIDGKQLAREVLCCKVCGAMLKEGMPYEIVRRNRGNIQQVVTVKVQEKPAQQVAPAPPPVHTPFVFKPAMLMGQQVSTAKPVKIPKVKPAKHHKGVKGLPQK